MVYFLKWLTNLLQWLSIIQTYVCIEKRMFFLQNEQFAISFMVVIQLNLWPMNTFPSSLEHRTQEMLIHLHLRWVLFIWWLEKAVFSGMELWIVTAEHSCKYSLQHWKYNRNGEKDVNVRYQKINKLFLRFSSLNNLD